MAEHPETLQQPRVPLEYAVVPAVVLLLLGGVAAYFGNQRLKALEDELALRPRVAIIDTDALITAERGQSKDAAAFDRGFAKANETISRLRDAGFLVIDRQYVKAAPDAIAVPAR
ncbi:MAG TPA: hypothetical protein PLN91_00660 [Rhodanobacteraceae bacterium]|nr:hypothetical protein [Rhodanobacteraceae bacterium]